MGGWLRGAVGIGQWVQACCQRIVWSVFCLSVCVCANSYSRTESMGLPARWYFWLQAVEVTWRGKERPYCCLVSKWLASGWKLAGMSRLNCLVSCGLGGSCRYCESGCWYVARGGVCGAECWCWCQFHGLLVLRHDMTVQWKNDRSGTWARISLVWRNSSSFKTFQ